ncbi:MAG: F0F1 ATP synthase subunit A [Chloroflexia bacterium]|nr:F0F1 ATP synthase subunit A [Chloroflexia bacterium]
MMGLLLIAGSGIARGAKLIPGRWQSLFEVTAAFILELVESTGGRSFGRRIYPLIGGVFMFILIANYTGILPGVGTIGFYRTEAAGAEADVATAGDEAAVETNGVEGTAVESETTPIEEEHADEPHTVLVPILRAPTADLNMTLALALVTFTTVQVLGIRAHGLGGRLKHMADPPFIFPIELVSEFGRIISLSARLFGNVLAGEVLLGVMYALANVAKIAIVPLLVPVIFIFLELLFGTIQALVFALLTAIYITMAAADSHGAEHHEAAHTPDDDHEPEHAATMRIPVPAGD